MSLNYLMSATFLLSNEIYISNVPKFLISEYLRFTEWQQYLSSNINRLFSERINIIKQYYFRIVFVVFFQLIVIMKKLFLSILFVTCLLATTSVNAQYKHALGVRLGDTYGVTFKTFLQSNKALDFILNVRNRDNYSSFRLTGLYEVHNPIGGAPGLRWYYGGGGTLGSINHKRSDDTDFYLSVDGVLGLDYKFNGAPINLSLDWKPAIEVSPNTEFDPRGVGFSVRITF